MKEEDIFTGAFGDYDRCMLCPRSCGANRSAGVTGYCRVTSTLKAARAALHFWEEPCISGEAGSGAVFFSGCSMHCVFCQNETIAQGVEGKEITAGRLAEIFLELQEKGANNINLVTPGHYLPHIIYAVESARNQGLVLPIVYNTSSYERVDQLKRLEGIVDIWLPDFKYWDAAVADRYAKAPFYSHTAKKAIAEMVRQQPKAVFYPEKHPEGPFSEEAEDGLIMKQGVIIRQLLLPGLLTDAETILEYLFRQYGNSVYYSLMSQFTPLPNVAAYPELNRRVTEAEYDAFTDFAVDLGIEHGFIQEGDVAEESFIPSFDYEGV